MPDLENVPDGVEELEQQVGEVDLLGWEGRGLLILGGVLGGALVVSAGEL